MNNAGAEDRVNQLPNSFVATGDFLAHGRRCGEPGQQSQTNAAF
jgi:hypothetical protein